MTQGEGGMALFATFVAFGIISISFYLLVLRPILPTGPPAGTPQAATGRAGAAFNQPTNGNLNNGRGRAAGMPGAGARGSADAGRGVAGCNNEDNSIDRVLKERASFPSHLAPGSQTTAKAGGANVLSDGILAFRHSCAANYEQDLSKTISNDTDVVTQNRKERARLLSRLLTLEDGVANATTTPPQRGSAVIVSIPTSEVTCSKLRRVLYLFGTYYNLLVILAVSETVKPNELEAVISKLRGNDESEKLAVDILPDHRIVAASTVAGRIAFVRQHGKAEVVVDFDVEVKTQLSRFGFRVVQYGAKDQVQNLADGASQLGNLLLS